MIAADLAYAMAWRTVRHLRPGIGRRAFELGADLATRRGGAGVRQLRANLARVVPPVELDAQVRLGMRSYARYWFEAFRLPAMDPAAVHAGISITGTAPFHEALAAGRGVVFAVPHSGNWDVAGVWVVETLRRLGREPAFTTVVQRLRPESLYQRFVAYRSGLGFEVVAADGGSATHRALTGRLRRGGVVCLVADRELGAGGVDVAFLGAPARFPAGPARLAALTGAVLMPAYPAFAPDGWTVRIGAPIPVDDRRDVAKATQALADAFGEMITARPADWHALQPIWTADRPA